MKGTLEKHGGGSLLVDGWPLNGRKREQAGSSLVLSRDSSGRLASPTFSLGEAASYTPPAELKLELNPARSLARCRRNGGSSVCS